jgi:hypothetical protein
VPDFSIWANVEAVQAQGWLRVPPQAAPPLELGVPPQAPPPLELGVPPQAPPPLELGVPPGPVAAGMPNHSFVCHASIAWAFCASLIVAGSG